MSGYQARTSKERIYRLKNGGNIILSLGDDLLLDLCGRLGRSRQLGLKGNRCERVGGREGVQDGLSLKEPSERKLKKRKGCISNRVLNFSRNPDASGGHELSRSNNLARG